MERRLNILFISMHYRPEPCDTRTSHLAKALAARGHRATALTSFPNYPFGKTYAGYRQRLVSKENIEGVEVIRVPMFPDHSKSKKRRAASYFSFGLSATILGALFTRRPDLIWIHHPPLTTGVAGWLLARIKRVPFVYEIHDLWPESLTSTGMVREGRLTRAIRKVCDFLHRRADAVVVTSEGMKTHLAEQGLDPAKIHVFHQWAEEAVFKPTSADSEFARSHGFAGKFNVVYGGNIGIAQGLDLVLEAAARLRDVPDLQLVCIGAGVDLERLRTRVAEEGLDNVRFLGGYPPEAMPAFFAQADGLLLQLIDDPLFEITVPTKLQTYMAMGKPVLCGVRGDAARIVEHTGCGFNFDPGDPDALAQAVRRLYGLAKAERDAMGANARRGYEAMFAQERLVNRYDLLFRQIVRGVPVNIPSHAVVAAPAPAEQSARG